MFSWSSPVSSLPNIYADAIHGIMKGNIIAAMYLRGHLLRHHIVPAVYLRYVTTGIFTNAFMFNNTRGNAQRRHF